MGDRARRTSTTVVIDPTGASEINNFEPGDIWYFAKGHGHAIQTIGDKPCNLLLAFDDGAFAPDNGAFSITDWIDLSPKDMLALEFGPGDVAYVPMGFGHAIRNTGDDDLEMVQVWDNGRFRKSS